MNVVFFGTADFGIPSLEAIVSNKRHTLVAAVTGPDRQRGRGLGLHPTPVGEWLAAHQFENVLKPESTRDAGFAEELRRISADVYAIVAYRILPESVYTIPRYAFNLHASLLPAYRGAAPIQRAIMAGEQVTGVTTFLLQKTVDTGAILTQHSRPIPPDATAGDMFDVLAKDGAELVIRTLDLLELGEFTPQPQDDCKASPAPKLSAADQAVDFSRATTELINRVRAFAPRPGATAIFRGNPVKILSLLPHNDASLRAGDPGEIVAIDKPRGPIVQAGDGHLVLGQVQPAGKKPMTGAEFARGYHPREGELFLTPKSD